MVFSPTLLMLLSLPLLSMGSNILLIPLPAHSHVRNMAQVGGPLANRGHNVYAVMNPNCHQGNQVLLDANVSLLFYPHPDNSCVAEMPPQDVKDKMVDMLVAKKHYLSLLLIAMYQSDILSSEGKAMFSDPTLMDRIRDKNIDLVIVDGTAVSMYHFIIPYKLDLPYITMMEFYHSQWPGVPDLPSVSPEMIGTNTNQMTFFQRLDNTLKHFTTPFICSLFEGSKDSLIREYAPEKADSGSMTMFQLQRGSNLWLMSVDHLMDYPRPLLPHVIYVGGLSTGPAKPLPETLAQVADSAQSGLVVVSFGSILSSLPRSITDRLLEAFKQTPEVTIIWKYNGPKMDDLPPHIHTLPWIPQNDLLGHPNTRAFITHSGYNGQFEALYHGVPMLGIPIFGDQPYNAARMEARGYGLGIPLMELTPESLVDKLKTVISDPKYRTNIQHVSKIFRNRIQSPQERAVYWVEHVLEYGADHLLSPSLKMPWYQFWMIDILVFVIIIFLSFSVAFYYTARRILTWSFPYSAKVKKS